MMNRTRSCHPEIQGLLVFCYGLTVLFVHYTQHQDETGQHEADPYEWGPYALYQHVPNRCGTSQRGSNYSGLDQCESSRSERYQQEWNHYGVGQHEPRHYCKMDRHQWSRCGLDWHRSDWRDLFPAHLGLAGQEEEHLAFLVS